MIETSSYWNLALDWFRLGRGCIQPRRLMYSGSRLSSTICEVIWSHTLHWSHAWAGTGTKANLCEMCFKHPPSLTGWRHIPMDISSTRMSDQSCQKIVSTSILTHTAQEGVFLEKRCCIMSCICSFLPLFFCALKSIFLFSLYSIWVWRRESNP